MLAILKSEYDAKIPTINFFYFLMLWKSITLDKYSKCACKFAGSVDLETQRDLSVAEKMQIENRERHKKSLQ